MAKFLIQKSASFRIDEIYRYSRSKWGEQAARKHIEEMFDAFAVIEQNQLSSRVIPSEFGISGFFFQYKKHFIYWKYLSNGEIGVVTVLHQRMHQIEQFKDLAKE